MVKTGSVNRRGTRALNPSGVIVKGRSPYSEPDAAALRIQMPGQGARSVIEVPKLSRRWQLSIVAGLVLIFVIGVFVLEKTDHGAAPVRGESDFSSQARRPGLFYPTAAQWAAVTIEPVEQRQFRAEFATEGKIAVNEDTPPPILSPYA